MPSIPSDPGGRQQKEGRISATLIHPGLGVNVQPHYFKQMVSLSGAGMRRDTLHRVTSTAWVGTGS